MEKIMSFQYPFEFEIGEIVWFFNRYSSIQPPKKYIGIVLNRWTNNEKTMPYFDCRSIKAIDQNKRLFCSVFEIEKLVKF